MHSQSICYSSKHSVGIKTTGWMKVVQALLRRLRTRDSFLLLFALLVVGFNHIDMKHLSYSATELLSKEEEGKVKVKGGELA
jgi:hypothetical protein